MDLTVYKMLQSLTPIEAVQQAQGQFVDDLPAETIDLTRTRHKQVPVLNASFFQNREIVVSKHNRFAPFPLHEHQFFEINFMLRGHASETINGQRVQLNQGDVLLLDIGSQHSIDALGEDDLLINILFRDQSLSLGLLQQMRRENSVLYEFLIQHSRGTDQQKGYIVFTSDGNEEIQQTLSSLITEYYRNREFADTIIQAELTILLSRLVRHYKVKPEAISPQQEIVVTMLKAINEDYRNVSLGGLAAQYAYNKNYLGNVFKAETGQTFSAALLQERLMHARRLLRTTKQPIVAIIDAVGLSNRNYFYHKYKDRFGRTPKEERDLV